MTGKDLFLVVLVAGTVGAGAAFAAGLVNAPAPVAEPTTDLASRLDRIETALARAADSQKEAKESVSKLTERVTGLQMDVNSAREALKAAADAQQAESAEGTATDSVRPGRAPRPRVANGTISLADGNVLHGEGMKLKFDDLNIEGFGSEAMQKRMQGLSTGLALRMLPEKERWDKAKADLGLQDYQVENLKRAVADRDAAMKEAMNVESSTDGTASRITIRRMDPAKLATARGDYDRKVTEALDSDQKKKWDEKGYGHAFGSPSGGGASIAIVQTMDVHAGEEKDDGK